MKTTVPVLLMVFAGIAEAQLIDRNKAPNLANEGIAKTYQQQAGVGRGTVDTPGSSLFIIARDPFRSIRRGRQLFQRKFTRDEGHGPSVGDGRGDIGQTLVIGAGLSDSCAGCHGRPRGSGGVGGVVVTRPDSRDSIHLFGLGLKEMLADEMTTALRVQRQAAVDEARMTRANVTKTLVAKGINFGSIAVSADGVVDTSRVSGVDKDLRVRPFFHHGGTISIREFIAGALNAEMGMQVVDPDLMQASQGGRVVTPAGMVLDGALDTLEAPVTDDPSADPDGDGVTNEVPQSILDHLEFYLLNYFKPATYKQTETTRHGRRLLDQAGCTSCHVAELTIDRDRRVADLETVYDPEKGGMNGLFATAFPLFTAVSDSSGHPVKKLPAMGQFLVKNIFTDFKRHDLGPGFWERNYDGTLQKEFFTTALWGAGSTAPYGHDGRSMNLNEVILRHGGEAQTARDRFAQLEPAEQAAIFEFLNSLVLFPPDDTASNLDAADKSVPNYPQYGHGSVKLTVLFNNPAEIE